MDWTRSLFDGMPHEDAAETLIANEGMARSLWQFFSACRGQGFNDDYAFSLTLVFFEGLWSSAGSAEGGEE